MRELHDELHRTGIRGEHPDRDRERRRTSRLARASHGEAKRRTRRQRQVAGAATRDAISESAARTLERIQRAALVMHRRRRFVRELHESPARESIRHAVGIDAREARVRAIAEIFDDEGPVARDLVRMCIECRRDHERVDEHERVARRRLDHVDDLAVLEVRTLAGGRIDLRQLRVHPGDDQCGQRERDGAGRELTAPAARDEPRANVVDERRREQRHEREGDVVEARSVRDPVIEEQRVREHRRDEHAGEERAPPCTPAAAQRTQCRAEHRQQRERRPAERVPRPRVEPLARVRDGVTRLEPRLAEARVLRQRALPDARSKPEPEAITVALLELHVALLRRQQRIAGERRVVREVRAADR